jgi:hypothetical protein
MKKAYACVYVLGLADESTSGAEDLPMMNDLKSLLSIEDGTSVWSGPSYSLTCAELKVQFSLYFLNLALMLCFRKEN